MFLFRLCKTILAIFIAFFIFLSCNREYKNPNDNSQINSISSFREIPGITADEIAAIEELISSRGSFSYGVTVSNETFIQQDGNFSGFTPLLAEYLTALFGIPFVLETHDRDELLNKFDAKTIDFVSELTLTNENTGKYFLTSPVAERALRVFIRNGANSIRMTEDLNGANIGFLSGSTSEELIKKIYPMLSFKSAAVNSIRQAAQMLMSGTIDAIITEETAESYFKNYGNITGLNILPFISAQFSFASSNAELEPLISAISKYIEAGGVDRMHILYIRGEFDYARFLFEQSLTPEEKAYIAGLKTSRAMIPITMEADNFPLCFYNDNLKEFQGVGVDILKEITLLSDIEFNAITSKNSTMAEILELVKNGDAAFDTEMIRTNSRENEFLWPEKPYAISRFALLSKSDYPDVKTYHISRVKVGLVKGTAAAEMHDLLFHYERGYKEYRTRNEALDALERGEIDLFLTNETMLLFQINYREKAGYKINVSFDTVLENSYFGFNKNEAMLCSIISKAQNLIDTERIFKGWSNRTYDYSKKLVRDRLVRSLFFSAALLVLLFILILLLIKNAKMTKEIVFAKDHAEQSNRSKSIFLSHMSHEIRTPMNAILGIAEIQLQNGSLAVETSDAFDKIYESGDLLLNIINDLLDLSKIESGRLELNPVKYDIPSLINDAIQINRMRFESMPIEFTLHIKSDMPLEFTGDVLRIKQILNNILSNAFKYTNKGKIDFYVSVEDSDITGIKTLIFRVKDTGQGMKEDQINRIFEEYTRFNQDLNRTTIGAGLGMTITKRLIELMNGEIKVESVFGEGSEFTVRIPQKREGKDVCGDDLIEKLKNFDFRNTTIMKKVQFLREFMPYGKVLIVDDVESNLYVAKGMMSPYGINIETASSGFEAIDKVNEGKIYNIIFMDHMMPRMDGIETVRILREMGYNHPIIALTANALVGRANMFLQNGFDAFLSKPIDSRELNLILIDFIRNKRTGDAAETAAPHSSEEHKSKADGSELKALVKKDIVNAINALQNISLSDLEIDIFVTTVHGLKGALLNINEKELSQNAFKLETAGRQRDYELLKKETPEFIKILKELTFRL